MTNTSIRFRLLGFLVADVPIVKIASLRRQLFGTTCSRSFVKTSLRILLLFGIPSILLFGSSLPHAHATIVIAAPQMGSPYVITGVPTPIVGGGTDQVGLKVTANFNTFDETLTWSVISAPNRGGVASSTHVDGWSLEADVQGAGGGDGTFGDPDEDPSADDGILSTVGEFWTFAMDQGKLPGGSVLEKLVLDGSDANIVFDRPVLNGSLIGTPYNPTADGSPTGRPEAGADDLLITGDANEFGAPASLRGRDFFTDGFDGSSEPDVTVTYMNQVVGTGTADLYTKVEIEFTGGGLSPGNVSSFNFAIDTDKTSGLMVPEPGSVVLVCLGSLFLFACQHRRISHITNTLEQ